MDEGMDPVSTFEYRYKRVNFLRFPIVEGIGPLKKFEEKSKSSRSIRFPIDEGIV